jgi:hypothetical protein
MEISKPLMSPTLNGVKEEGRPESPRSPTKTIIPITPGLAPPTPYGGGYNHSPSPEPSSIGGTPGITFSNSSTPNTATTYATSYGSSPVTPRRIERNERKEDTQGEGEQTTPRKRSNSADKDAEKETQIATRPEPRSHPSRERPKDGLSNPMKSFRVNLDDPCWKVLPAAMKKYDVKGREEDYRLYITYGDTGISFKSHLT